MWWVRTGLGAVLCLGTVGCMGTGKSPPPRIGSNANAGKPTTLPPPGLPGIQPISATTPAPTGTSPRPATPNAFTSGVGATGAVQPAGGFNAPPAGVQPAARTVGQPVTPVGVPSAGPVPLPPTAPVGAGAGQLPPPSLDPPTAQRSYGATPPPPALDPIAPPPPPSPVISNSHYSPVAPVAPPQPHPAPVPVNVAPSQSPQFGTP
ncbi:unnamed protein product [Gemmataceae bacterium]|nr:unnamed protein product [Gemmataceae bacterium]VTT99483.1 unnamed protein product [Gemmataceae bacterium]